MPTKCLYTFTWYYMRIRKKEKSWKYAISKKNVHFRNKNPKNLTRGLKTAIMAKNDRRIVLNVHCRIWISCLPWFLKKNC